MLDMINIRKEFNEKFIKLAKNRNVEILKEWGKIPFPEDTNLCSWINEPIKRGMRIQEAEEDETIVFDGFTYHGRGVNEDITELVLSIKNSPKFIAEIFNLYKLWFYSNISPKDMDNLLREFENKLNSFK
jgi:hypothetical protein